ncbi:hypothetical protein [Zavarzinella formosa]|uniref:hypothetical protein n=1 Tax=Zavarzinella formosa TaxID=360055 RepID=UPI0003139268|nr:hypothetical protein [Zavarzinella formosa]
MSASAIIVHDGEDSHRLLVTHRDWGLLWGPQFPEGSAFSGAFGVHENFTVAGGIAPGSRVIRRGGVLCDAARALLSAIERDAEALRYDYSYGFSGNPAKHGGAQSIRIHGRSGIISTQPKGYCHIRLDGPVPDGQPRIDEHIDLRRTGPIETGDGVQVRSYRRRAPMNWLESLPPLVEFLESRLEKDLQIEHQDRVI